MTPPVPTEVLADALRALPVAVALVRSDVYVFANDQFCEVVGHPREGLLGRAPFELVEPSELPAIAAAHAARLRGDPIPRQYQVTCVTADGQRRVIEVEVEVLPSGDSIVVIRAVAQRARDRELLTALGELQARVQRQRSVDAALDATVHGLRTLGFNATVGQLVGDECVMVAHAFQPEVKPLLQLLFKDGARGLSIPLARMPVTQATLREGRSYFRDDATESLVRLALQAGADPERIAAARRGMRPLHVAISPLVLQGRTWGVLMALAEDLRTNDAAALALFASQVASSMEVAQNIEHLEAIHQVALFGAEQSQDALLQRLLPVLARATRSDATAIFLIDADQKVIRLAGSTLPPESVQAFRQIPMPEGLLDGAGPQRKSISLEEIPQPYREHARRSGLHQMAVVPLAVNGRVGGLLSMGRTRPLPYADHELRSAEILSGQAALQLERVRLYADARARVEQLSLINELGAAIARHLDLEEVFGVAVRHVSRIVGVPNTFLFLLDAAGETLELGATNVDLAPLGGLRLPVSENSAASSAVRTLAPVVIDDAATDERTARALADHFGHRALMAVPIVSEEKAIGALVLGETRTQRRFSAEEVDRAVAVANQVGTAIVNARLYADVRRSYEELSRAQQKLVKRERLAALGELSALVAHEVRNPLGVIFNSIASLKRLPAGSEDAGALLALVEEEAERLNRMVNDLLDFAGPSAARVRPERLELVLSGALEAATRAQPSPNVRLELRVSPQLPEVPVDAHMLRQAVVNLVVNAIQAMPPGGGRVSVRADPFEHLGRRIARLVVADDGPGMADTVAARAFEPFFTTRAAGTGLGLAVVKRIADAHGGEVGVETSPGRGAAFTLLLPLGA